MLALLLSVTEISIYHVFPSWTPLFSRACAQTEPTNPPVNETGGIGRCWLEMKCTVRLSVFVRSLGCFMPKLRRSGSIRFTSPSRLGGCIYHQDEPPSIIMLHTQRPNIKKFKHENRLLSNWKRFPVPKRANEWIFGGSEKSEKKTIFDDCLRAVCCWCSPARFLCPWLADQAKST